MQSLSSPASTVLHPFCRSRLMINWRIVLIAICLIAVSSPTVQCQQPSEDRPDSDSPESIQRRADGATVTFWFAELCRLAELDELAFCFYFAHSRYSDSPWCDVADERGDPQREPQTRGPFADESWTTRAFKRGVALRRLPGCNIVDLPLSQISARGLECGCISISSGVSYSTPHLATPYREIGASVFRQLIDQFPLLLGTERGSISSDSLRFDGIQLTF
jgi:hypothetical protein